MRTLVAKEKALYFYGSSIRFRVGVRSLTLAGFTAMVAISNAQTLFQVTERALPGDPINFVGDSLGGDAKAYAQVLDANGNPGPAVELKIVTHTDQFVQAELPKSLQVGEWQVWIQGAAASNHKYVNRADVYFADQDIAQPGGVVTLFGRNFQVLGQKEKPIVSMQSDSGERRKAEVEEFGPYSCTVRVPKDINPSSVYKFVLNNGFGGTAGDDVDTVSIHIAPVGDPFQLGIGWGSDYAFANNVINIQSDRRLKDHADGRGGDATAALREAARLASQSGGGVVYLPAGSYTISAATGVHIGSNVVLKGDGPGQTYIDFGSEYTPASPPPPGPWVLDFMRSNRVGVFGITFRNHNTSDKPNTTILFSPGLKNPSSEVFMKNCDFEIGNGQAVKALGVTHLLLNDSTIAGEHMVLGPIDCMGDKYVTVKRCKFSHRAGRYQFSYCLYGDIEDNTMFRDTNFAAPKSAETGGLELSGARYMVARHNTIRGIGPFPKKNWDGELINFQRANLTDMEDVGNVTSASATTLESTSANWPTDRAFSTPDKGQFNRAIVAIIKGKGMGQWRQILSNTSSQLVIDDPWQVVPDSTSVWMVGWWGADRILVLNNTVGNSNVGIEFWSGGWKCVADGNTVDDAGAILLRGEDVFHDQERKDTDAPTDKRRHSLAWDNWISFNNLTDVTGNRPAMVSITAINVNLMSYGNLLMNNTVRGNHIVGKIGTKWQDQNGKTAGVWNQVVYMYMDNNQPTSDPITDIGTLILDNDIENADTPIHQAAVVSGYVRKKG